MNKLQYIHLLTARIEFIIYIYIYIYIYILGQLESFRSVMEKVLNSGLEESALELKSTYYIHFRTNALGKGINPLIFPIQSWVK